VSSLLLAAALGLSPGAGCALGPAARPTGAPPVAPVALLTEGSAFTRPGMRERIGKAVEQISGRPVLLVDPPERNSDRRRGLAGKLAKENRELAGYDWREPRCAAEATVLAALTSSTDAVYRVTLDAVAHTRPVTPADLRSPAACPRGLGKVLAALHGAEPNAVREESVTGNIALSLFSRSPSAPRVGVEQRATCLEPGAPATLLDLPAIVADALRELPPPHAPEWEAYTRRLLAAGCPLLALSVAEARLGTGPTFKSLQSAALDAMRRHPDGFPRYFDKGSNLSATLMKHFKKHKLLPSEKHTVYSFRHSFKDRLKAVEAPEELIDEMMGHTIDKPKYGDGYGLKLKLKYLQAIALTPPLLAAA